MNRGQPVVLLLLLFLALGVVAQLVPLYTDWLWFQEVGYTEVFTKTLALRGSLFLGLALAVLVFLYVNLTFAARTAAPDVIWELEDQLGLPGRVVIEPLIRRFLPVVLFAISLVAGLRATVHWETLLRYFNALEFGRTDPLFGRDLSFFVFVLPFWRLLYGWAITLVVSTIILTLAVYVLQRSLVLTTRGPRLAAVHRAQHPDDAPGVRARPDRGAELPRRRNSRRPGARAQRPDDREHPALGSPPAAADLRPAPGDPDLLQVRGRRQRPVHDQGRVQAAHALDPRALLRAPPVADLDQRAPDLHPRLRRRRRTRQPDHARGAARVPGEGHPAAVDGRLPGDYTARDLFRRSVERVRAGPHAAAGAELPVGRPERLHDLRRHRRNPHRVLCSEAPLRDPLRRVQDPPLQRPHGREPDHDLSRRRRAGAPGHAVLQVRPRPVHGRHRRRASRVDARRLHDDDAVPLLGPGPRRGQLRPELRQGDDRRLPWGREILPRRRDGPDRASLRPRIPRAPPAVRRDARGSARAHPLPRGLLRHPGAQVRHVPHGGPASLLQQGRPVDGPAANGRRTRARDGALLHDHAAAGGEEGGVHPPHALQPEPPRQHNRLARRALGPAELRQPARLRLPQAEAGLRPAPDRRADRPGPRDLTASLALEPARLHGDPRIASGNPDRSVADLRPAALPRRVGAGGAARAPARDRRLRQPDRDGADAPAVARPHLRRPRPEPGARCGGAAPDGARRGGDASARAAGVGDLEPCPGRAAARGLGGLRNRAEAPGRDAARPQRSLPLEPRRGPRRPPPKPPPASSAPAEPALESRSVRHGASPSPAGLRARLVAPLAQAQGGAGCLPRPVASARRRVRRKGNGLMGSVARVVEEGCPPCPGPPSDRSYVRARRRSETPIPRKIMFAVHAARSGGRRSARANASAT